MSAWSNNSVIFYDDVTTDNVTRNDTVPYDASCISAYHDDESVMTSIRVFFGASLTFVVVGLIGNGLSMAVFSSAEMQTVSSNVYLLALAASDSLYLVNIFLSKLLVIARCWYFPLAEVDIINRSEFMCAALQYLSDLFSDYSTCLILAFTVERSVAVFLPIRFRELCTVWRARFTCSAIFAVVAVAIAPYHFLSMGLYPEYHVCAVLPEYENLFAIVYVVELCVLRVGPVIIIALLNAFIIVRITAMTRAKNKRRSATKIPMTESSPGSKSTGAGCRATGGGGGASGGGNAGRRNQAKKNDDRNLQLTVILILVSTSYVILYIPVLVDFGLRKLELSKVISPSKSTMAVVGNLSKAMYIGGFGINFFLYTMSGRVFRDQLRGIMCSWGKKGGGGGRGIGGEMSGNGGCKTMATSAPHDPASPV